MKFKKFISMVISIIMLMQLSSVAFAEDVNPYPPQRPAVGNMKVDVVSFAGGYTAVVGLRTNGTVNVLGYETPNIEGLAETMNLAKYETNVVDVACAQFAIALLKADGTVKFIIAAEHTSEDMYVNPPYWTDIAAIASGNNHIVGLKTDGTVVAFGDNSKGQASVSGWSRVSKIQAKDDYTIAIRADGTVIAAGEFSNFNDLRKATNVTSVFQKVGYLNELTVLSDGILEDNVKIDSRYDEEFPTLPLSRPGDTYDSNVMEIYQLKGDGSKIIDADGTGFEYYLLNENGNLYELSLNPSYNNYKSFELVETNIKSVTTIGTHYYALDNNGQICSNEMAFTSDDWILTTNITYNGNKINTDVPPYIKGGRTLAPIRAILEALGMTVTWDAATKTAIAVKADTTINITVNSNIAIVNGEQKTLDIPAEITNNRTFVPVRFFAEALNMNVDWDSYTKTVIINSK